MTWSYSNNPSNSELDRYRFLIGDTNSKYELLQDEEIQFILDEYKEHDKRLYLLYDRLANLFAKDIKRSLGPQSEDPTSRQKYYAEKASYYKHKCLGSGIYLPKYKSDKIFSKGMHNNV